MQDDVGGDSQMSSWLWFKLLRQSSSTKCLLVEFLQEQTLFIVYCLIWSLQRKMFQVKVQGRDVVLSPNTASTLSARLHSACVTWCVKRFVVTHKFKSKINLHIQATNMLNHTHISFTFIIISIVVQKASCADKWLHTCARTAWSAPPTLHLHTDQLMSAQRVYRLTFTHRWCA